MTPFREAIILPLLFLTVVLLAGVRPAGATIFVPPGLFALVLAVLMLGALVRSGALAPERLLAPARGAVANANGVCVVLSAYAAAAQLLALVMPESGLPLFFVSVFLLVLLLNTWVSLPDRVHVLRSLMVIFGAAFVLKFVVLASLSDPDGGRMKRALMALFDAATLGGITQPPQPHAAGYLAFVAIVLFLVGVSVLPARRHYTTSQLRITRGDNSQDWES
ncbi:MAG TPA: hypothetical protein VNR64_20525 [Vicinamibacterales bacterium]|nr:hypothetical protein [Vicinamibacterales bacterium]